MSQHIHHPSCLARHDAAAECICPPTRRRLPRKTLVGLSSLALLLVAGVAFALYVLNLKVDGNVDTRSAGYQWAQTPAPTGSGTAATCTVGAPALSGSNTLPSIKVSGYPGDDCTITASVKTMGAAEDFRVTGVALTGLPATWTATLAGSSCGKTLPSAGTATSVQLKITVGDTGTGAFSGGLTASPVSQVGTGAITCS